MIWRQRPICCEYQPEIVDDPGPVACGGFRGAECPPGLVCVDDPNDRCDPERGGADCPGICVDEPPPPAGCIGDVDCAEDGQFCRDVQDSPERECVDYQSEGGRCGGFVPPWAVERCAPGLSCTDIPPNLPDAPGTCRVSCLDEACGNAEQYCSSNDYCRDDGACLVDADCELMTIPTSSA